MVQDRTHCGQRFVTDCELLIWLAIGCPKSFSPNLKLGVSHSVLPSSTNTAAHAVVEGTVALKA